MEETKHNEQSSRDSYHEFLERMEITSYSEDYYDELLAYLADEELHADPVQRKAESLGVPDKIDLVRYIDELEYRISLLENRVKVNK